MRRTVTLAFALIVAMLGFAVSAQAPQSGVYRIQNVGKSTYVKVTGKYDAQLVTSQNEASYITVGIEKKLSDGTYKVNSLASTYDGGSVEVYDYLTKALTLGEIELRRELSTSSEENIQRAIARMHELAQQYGFMRMMPVDGQADTYHAVAVLPTIPEDVVAVWRAKKNPDGTYVSQITGGNTMWDWCIDIVYRYLDEHSGVGGTNAALASKIRNNLKNIKEGHTYMLTADEDGSFGYIDTDGAVTSSLNRSWWKLTPKVNNDNVKDGTYKIHNIGKGDNGYVQITGRYHAKPDATEDNASDIRITFDGEANGGQKIVNLGGTYNGTDIDIYNYLEKAILIGKMAIYDVLTQGNGVNPASPENIAIAQEYLETEIKKAAFMCIKPVPGKEDAVYAYATFPHIPEEVITQMYRHHAITAETEAAAWEFAKQKVRDYLDDHAGTDNTLRAYILANIDNINPGTTYYLSAHPTDGTFDYAAEGAFDLTDEYFQWGFEVEDVEEDNLTSGTYKVRNVHYKNFVEVLSKYYAKPDTDEENATEIHITFNGKLDDGSFKVVNMSAVAKDGSQADLLSYVDKAIMLGKVAIADVLNGKSTPENIKKAQDYMEEFVRANAFMRIKPVAGTNYVYAIATIPEIPYDVYHEMFRHGVIIEDTKEAAWEYGVNYVMNYLSTHGTNSTLAQLIRNNIGNIQQGHTYYLSEDSNNTFGYVDAENFSSTDDKTILQWGIDLEEEDQPVESDFYKIHNVGNNKWVKIEEKYYARPNYDEEDATPIYVTIGDQLEDGSYKVTNLSGEGQDVQEYIQDAIELGEAVLRAALPNSSEANIQRAINAMTNFIKKNAYMRIRQVPGEDSAYYAYVVLPTVPDSIVTEWRNKYPNYNGTMRDWAVEKVKEYLNKPGNNTNSKLKSMILNNIDKLYEGHTYYLRADQDNTFGIGDFTENEVNLTDRHYWWGFASPIIGEPASGYFRIRNAQGVGDKKYVNVIGRLSASPNKTAEEAKTLPGSVIYVGMGKSTKTSDLTVDTLRSQGVNVNGYIDYTMQVVNEFSTMAASIIAEQMESTSYSEYTGLIEPMIQTLISSVDTKYYAEPTITSTGESAYFLKASVPDLREYCNLALDALSLLGHDQQWLSQKFYEHWQAGGQYAKLYEYAWHLANNLDDPDRMWEKIKERILNNLDLIPSPVLQQYLRNNLAKLNYGVTYCLSEDSYATFDFVDYKDAKNDDLCKWVLEPFDITNVEDGSAEQPYLEVVADTPVNQVVKPTDDHEQTSGVTTIKTQYLFTTTYLDFDAKIESENTEAFIVTINDEPLPNGRIEHPNLSTNPNDPNYGKVYVYYLAQLQKIAKDGVIPAQTPVVIRTVGDSETANVKFIPVGKPAPETAYESNAIEEKLAELMENLLNEVGLGTSKGTPMRIIHEDDNNADNKMVGSFFGDPIPEDESAANYLELKSSSAQAEDGNYILNISGVGFWRNDDLTKLESNKAYLHQANYGNNIPLSAQEGYKNPGYIFQFEDGTMTAVNDVVTTKSVKAVRYYNIAGIESAQPFNGINIVVTTYSDGSKSSVKILR